MKKNILLIDDDDLVRVSLKLLLKNKGYNVGVAKSALEAVEKIKRSEFDLVISDVRMPEIDGIETVKLIRLYLEKSNKKPVPEILITGYADKDKYNESASLKVAGYLYKPFENKDLLRLIEKCL